MSDYTVKTKVGIVGTIDEVVAETFTGSAKINVTEDIADGETDKLISHPSVDVSAVKVCYITSNYAILLEPNDGAVPDDPITLVGGKPYLWKTADYASLHFGTDITSIHATNASGSTATVKFEWLLDATP